MKKIVSCILLFCFLFTLISCSTKDKNELTSEPLKTEETTIYETDSIFETESETETSGVSIPPSLANSFITQSNTEVSSSLATELLNLCTMGTETATKNALETAGFQIVLKKNYDKANTSTEHTCAWMLAKKQIVYKTDFKNAYIVVIRGTNGSEWVSNFDFCNDLSKKTVYADNFYACAKDIYDTVYTEYLSDKNSLLFLTGHSRGAAAANLLGVLVDQARGTENVFVYTFATPNTVTTDFSNVGYNNIFNFINPSDIVTELPLKSMQFTHAGTDILLNGNADILKVVQQSVQTLSNAASSIDSYYTDKHSLTQKGIDENGMTMFDVLKYCSNGLAGITPSSNPFASLQPASDLYPVYTFFSDINGLYSILSEHMPVKYTVYISVWATLNNK